MCGRYALHSHPDVVALQFGLDVAPQFDARYNICPSTKILVIRTTGERKRAAETCRWGLGNKLANVRGETVAEKPAFRDAFRQARCLVPASGFYEWQTVAAKRHPWYVRPKDAGIFALAGITALWNGVHSVALITTRPNELMESIHGRMPVIVLPESYGAWLDRGNANISELQNLLRPYASERMEAYPVSLRVNTPRNDDPALIERI
jgi:putative SOS response-associated peptidase YedK